MLHRLLAHLPVAALAMCAASGIAIGQEECRAPPQYTHSWEEPAIPWTPKPRSVLASTHPGWTPSELHVAGGIATTVLFPSALDPRCTKLVGGEGRFEPLMVAGRAIVIIPLTNLDFGEHFSLITVLQDGTSFPLTLTSSGTERTDGQVNVYLDPDSVQAMRNVLEEKRDEAERLERENQKLRQQETSPDHALATFLAAGQDELTRFKQLKIVPVRGRESRIRIITYGPREKGMVTDKEGIVVEVSNDDAAKPWVLEEARLTTFASGEAIPFALRMSAREIGPGKVGRIAVVAEPETFRDRYGEQPGKFVLELFRNGGFRYLYAEFSARNGTVALENAKVQ